MISPATWRSRVKFCGVYRCASLYIFVLVITNAIDINRFIVYMLYICLHIGIKHANSVHTSRWWFDISSIAVAVDATAHIEFSPRWFWHRVPAGLPPTKVGSSSHWVNNWENKILYRHLRYDITWHNYQDCRMSKASRDLHSPTWNIWWWVGPSTNNHEHTLWYPTVATESPPFIDIFSNQNTSIYSGWVGFSIAMFSHLEL